MSFRLIEDHRHAYPIRVLCAVLEVSPAGYYAWRARAPSARSSANAELVAAIRRVHHDSGGRYGSPRVHAALRTQGRGTCARRVLAHASAGFPARTKLDVAGTARPQLRG